MNLPKTFSVGKFEAIDSAINSEKWVLIATTDNTKNSEELAERLNDEFLQDVLGNFVCFEVSTDSEAAEKFCLEYPVALYIFVNEREPEYIYEFSEPEFIFTEDITQFLDDSASDILYGDELNL